MWHRTYYFRLSVLRSLIKPLFKGKEPLCIASKEAQKKLLNDYKSALNIRKNVKIDLQSWYTAGNTDMCYQIEFGAKYVHDLNLIIGFREGQLHLINDWRSDTERLAPISCKEDLIALEMAIRAAVPSEEERYAEMARDSAQNSVKIDKIKTLKKTAIVAKVKEVMAMGKNHYYIDDSYANKIKLNFDLSTSLRMEVDIPYSNYQIVLQNLKEAIQSISALIDKGITIKIR